MVKKFEFSPAAVRGNVRDLFTMFREARNLSQKEVAELLGLTRVTINRYENGKLPLSYLRMWAVQKYLLSEFPKPPGK